MNWIKLLQVIQQVSPIEAFLLAILTGYLIYKGYLKLPINKSDSKDVLSVHRDCKNFPSILLNISDRMKRTDDILRIKYIDTIYEQMSFAEQSWGRIKKRLNDVYKTMLLSELTEQEQKESLQCYDLILKHVKNSILGDIRAWCKRNHFIEKTEIEYQVYIKQRVTDLVEIFDDVVSSHWVTKHLKVERKSLKDENNRVLLEYVNIEITDLFMQIREVAKEKTALIKEIEGLEPRWEI